MIGLLFLLGAFGLLAQTGGNGQPPAAITSVQASPPVLSLSSSSATIRAGDTLIFSVTITGQSWAGSLKFQNGSCLKGLSDESISMSGGLPWQKHYELETASCQGSQKPAVIATLLVDESKLVASKVHSVEVIPSVDLRTYLLWGMVGVLLGYLIRLLIMLLTAAEALPADPPLNGDAEGMPPPVAAVKWVRDHYYWVDGLVMLALGYMVLVYTAKNNIPPELAVSSPHSMVFGAALGLLTNTSLLTRLPAVK